MARVEAVDSDSDGHATTKTKKKAASSKDNKGSPEVDEVQNEADAASDEDEEAESEYEIEEIIDAKRGTFPGGRLGYLVKWKGYDSSHNSWVDENDAGNATVLVDAYWKKHSKKDKASRKSLDARPKPGSKIPTKKSLAKDDDSEVGSASVVKKRGRPKAKKDDTDAEDSEAPKKKPRKSNGAEASSKKGAASKKTLEASQDDEDQEMDDDTPIGDMQKYMKVPSWEHLVEAIDTVERTAKGELDVYFRLVTGDRAKENSRLCAIRFPQKLITFYESNLRWKISDS